MVLQVHLWESRSSPGSLKIDGNAGRPKSNIGSWTKTRNRMPKQTFISNMQTNIPTVLPYILNTKSTMLIRLDARQHMRPKKTTGPTKPMLIATNAGWSSPVARQAHNLKVVSSNLAPATNPLKASLDLFRNLNSLDDCKQSSDQQWERQFKSGPRNQTCGRSSGKNSPGDWF